MRGRRAPPTYRLTGALGRAIAHGPRRGREQQRACYNDKAKAKHRGGAREACRLAVDRAYDDQREKREQSETEQLVRDEDVAADALPVAPRRRGERARVAAHRGQVHERAREKLPGEQRGAATAPADRLARAFAARMGAAARGQEQYRRSERK